MIKAEVVKARKRPCKSRKKKSFIQKERQAAREAKTKVSKKVYREGRSNKEVVYLHFNVRRKKGSGTGIFCIVLCRRDDYKDKEIVLLERDTLWEDNDFTPALQALDKVLAYIRDVQGRWLSKGVKQVYLVSDNQKLVRWLENPFFNERYGAHLRDIMAKYRAGGLNEMKIGVGVADVVDFNKAYQYCNESCLADFEASEVKPKRKSKAKTVFEVLAEKEGSLQPVILS